MSDLLRERVVRSVQDQYELEGEIGRGGMSVVYRARDLRLNRPVALKVLPPDLAYDPAVRMRFTREAQTAAQLTHPHIVPIHDVGERDGIAWLVMAHVAGGNLAALLAQEPRQPVPEVIRLLCEIADALEYAHQRGVVHRDIKPDNILLDGGSGRALVTDFGIARAMEAGARLTATGNAVGTPAYMSPEQAVGDRDVDGRSDLYALGVLGYQMITGRVPFTAANPMALLMKQVGEKPRPITELRPDTPRALREVVERALQKDPDERWPSAAAMKEALQSGGTRAPWRPESRDVIRYTSPARGTPASDAGRRPPLPAAPDAIVMVPPHLAGLTKEQRDDLRLWNGRVNLLDRIKLFRPYALWAAASIPLSLGGIAAAIDADIPPLILAPFVSAWILRKAWKRGKSLQESGVSLRRALFMLRAKWVLPRPADEAERVQLEKLAPRDVLDGAHGSAIRRAVEDRAAMMAIVRSLSHADRALLPDVEPTAEALVQRVVELAVALSRFEPVDPRLIHELEHRLAAAERDLGGPEAEQRLVLLRRQRETLNDIEQRREALGRQLESAGLALRNLRFDMVKLRSSGLQAALSDVSSATREARALSRDIGNVLEAVDEVKKL